MNQDEYLKYAGIQYVGEAGITRSCLQAIARLLHFGDQITEAKLISCPNGYHGFILTVNKHDVVAIKAGFSSGYRGEGPSGLSMALQILMRHDVDIDEFTVREEFIERLNFSCLRSSDMNELEESKPIRPTRYHDYVLNYEEDFLQGMWRDERMQLQFPVTIPYRIIDVRLMDLALVFARDMDSAVTRACRRLEDIIRKKAELKSESSSRLFAKVFLGEESILHWGLADKG